jgi:hypothetical protein
LACGLGRDDDADIAPSSSRWPTRLVDEDVDVIGPERSYPVVMLTVMYDDTMPTADELERFAGSLLTDGCVEPGDAERVAQVLREVALGLRRGILADHVSDEGFD